MKNKEILLKASFYIFLLVMISGTLFRFFHKDEANLILAVGILFYLVFITSSISEILSIPNVSKNEKNMWINGFIILTPIAGLVYILSGRKRILKDRKS